MFKGNKKAKTPAVSSVRKLVIYLIISTIIRVVKKANTSISSPPRLIKKATL